MKHKHIILLGMLLALSLVLVACSRQPAPTIQATQAAVPTSAPCPTSQPCAELEPAVQAPFEELWANSPHADAEAEAFVHWNEEDPAEVPANCATCHSSSGYQDFLGADGSAAGSVENAVPVGEVVTCVTCHNEVASNLSEVTFPSGQQATGLGPEARCMVCHQGRASQVQVDAAIENNGLTGQDDTVGAELGFINIHYFAAGATLYGNIANGGYQYEGQAYDGKFHHVESYDSCAGCHDTHSLQVKVDQCSACHQDVASAEDLRNIRMLGSAVDYDGDGDTEEGIAFEIETLQEKLLQAIQAYAVEEPGTAIAYDSARHPYFFIDTNANGQADPDEAVSDNRYASWTPRLLKAAFNYQTTLKDPGAFAHNAKYFIQLLHDSIADLNSAVTAQVDMEGASRTDAGHFQGTAEAFRHWDEEEPALVPGGCAKCHSASGLPIFLGEASRTRDLVTGLVIAQQPSNGLGCTTCHNDMTTFSRHPVEAVLFPSSAVVTFGEGMDANLCLECHQGREANSTVKLAIQRSRAEDADAVTEGLTFRNPHYFAAGATLFGSEAQGAYQYDGKEYLGRFLHIETFNTCILCHDTHSLAVNTAACAACHPGAEADLASIRGPASPADYDGDGDTAEGIGEEVATMHESLYAAIQSYASETAGSAIVYSATAYPYWFIDTNANGEGDPDELTGSNGYASWTPRLLAAAYNYTWAAKDPGSFAHNGKYVLQFLYDSIEDLGGDVSGMTRP